MLINFVSHLKFEPYKWHPQETGNFKSEEGISSPAVVVKVIQEG